MKIYISTPREPLHVSWRRRLQLQHQELKSAMLVQLQFIITGLAHVNDNVNVNVHVVKGLASGMR